jgi:diguanylate cyclase (GGDEF)-like protein
VERALGGEQVEGDEVPLQQRVKELEVQLQSQAREIRTLEKIELLQDRNREIEEENHNLRQQVGELHTFLNLSKVLSATLDMEELLRLALHLIGRSLHVDAYSLMLLEERGERLVAKAAFGLPADGAVGLTLRVGEGISGLVAQTGQPMLVPDVSTEARFQEERSFWQQRGAFLCVPLRIKGRGLIGVLNAQKPDPPGFRLSDLDLFQAVANQVATALENAQLYERTKELSTHDDLTGLFNRRHFFDHLEKEVQRARRYQRVFSLLMLDLDDFKRYNDSHGHLKGDEALKEVARLLQSSIRRVDMVARFGGDEFVVLLPEIAKQKAAMVAEKIRTAVELYPFVCSSTQSDGKMTVTAGLATYPEDSQDSVELVDLADRTLYVGKQQGGNRVSVPPGRHESTPQAT